MRHSRALWIGAVLGGAALVGLGVLFVVVGLDKADKIASSVGAFVGLAGLGASVYGLVAMRRASGGNAPPPPPPPPPAPPPVPPGSNGASGERSVVARDISGIVVTGDDNDVRG
ncbi:hypothetical protein [Spirillospora sp. NPDC047279]|uniref:hypothetical protein n=1 Tax=Spirillospora sp. NPDC047279 TaxID=3155478 RepID=UPI003403E8DD